MFQGALEGPAGPLGTQGNQGPQGQYIVQIFRNFPNATPPTGAPVGGSVDIVTGILTPPTGWSLTLSAPGSTSTSYLSQATVDPATASDPYTPIWGVPAPAASVGPTGPVGPQGIQGLRGLTIQFIYQNAATMPNGALAGAGVDADGLLNAAPSPWVLSPTSPPVGQSVWAQIPGGHG